MEEKDPKDKWRIVVEKQERKGKWIHGTHIVSSTLCPPSVRTVILMAHIFDDEPPEVYKEVIPVLAIQSLIVENYARHTFDEKECGLGESSRRVLLDKGYGLQSRIVEIRLVHVDPDYGLTSTEEGAPSPNGVSRIIACTWPKEQDEKEFEPIFQGMEKSLREQKALNIIK